MLRFIPGFAAALVAIVLGCAPEVEPVTPPPSLTGAVPNQVLAGGGALTIALQGADFTSGSRVRVNGADRTTRYLGSTALEADLLASDVASATVLTLHVFSGPPGGGASGTITFTVTALSGCGEAACTPITAAYISHFQELNCTGPEAYYTAYKGFDGIRRSWNGTGEAGTIIRTLTHKSYKEGATCSNQWPAGNTLPDFVRIYR